MLPFNFGPGEMLVIGLLGVLLFGKKLPEVGRSLGKGIVEFKKGLRGVEDEFDHASTSSSTASSSRSEPMKEDAGMVSIPKFEPPVSAPSSTTTSYEPQSYGH